MKIAVIWGTRPEIIKLSPVIRELKKRKLNFFLIHTNQHYSSNMDKIFLKELKIPKPKYNLNVGSGNHAEQTGKIMIKLERVLIKEKSDLILVQGDTNSVLAGALTSSKLGIKIGHIEAGLRSFDKDMPEEINRIITDHISDYLFCPTKISKQNLLNEGIKKEKIFITGNTIVDAIKYNLSKIKKDKLNEEYILATFHRPSNVDKKENLMKIFDFLSKETSKIIFPIHPRTKKMINKFKIKIPKNVSIIEPVGYFDFLRLEKNAKRIYTDSGGIQEEACIFGVPCLTFRDNTERPETLLVGANKLINLKKSKKQIFFKKKWKHPFGNNVSKKILEIIKKM